MIECMVVNVPACHEGLLQGFLPRYMLTVTSLSTRWVRVNFKCGYPYMVNWPLNTTSCHTSRLHSISMFKTQLSPQKFTVWQLNSLSGQQFYVNTSHAAKQIESLAD